MRIKRDYRTSGNDGTDRKRGTSPVFRLFRHFRLFHVLLCILVGAPMIADVFSQGVAVPKRPARPQPNVKLNASIPKIQFQDIAAKAGLTARHVTGAQSEKKYIIETTGSGVALFDYDNDGWLDIFLVNGTTLATLATLATLDGFPKGQEPTNHLYRNNKNGTFTDVTEKANLARSGWGQGACVGDFDNDGYDDLFVTYWGQNALYRNNGNGTFTDITEKAGLLHKAVRWSTGCSFLDYDKDGDLEIGRAHV